MWRCTQPPEMRRWLLRYLAALVAALAAILGFTTASASAAGVAETRVGAFNVAGQLLVEPPQHVSAGQRLGEASPHTRFVVATGVAANAGRSRAFQFGNLPPGVLGSTDELGNITIQRGLSGKVFEETLRHETVHSVLTPRAPLNRLTVGLYNKSGLYRYAEEALAEGYALRSVRAGLAFPLREGYVSGIRLGLEGGGAAAGAGGLAYWWSQ